MVLWSIGFIANRYRTPPYQISLCPLLVCSFPVFVANISRRVTLPTGNKPIVVGSTGRNSACHHTREHHPFSCGCTVKTAYTEGGSAIPIVRWWYWCMFEFSVNRELLKTLRQLLYCEITPHSTKSGCTRDGSNATWVLMSWPTFASLLVPVLVWIQDIWRISLISQKKESISLYPDAFFTR